MNAISEQKKNQQELQNIITSTILRQHGFFAKSDIYVMVNAKIDSFCYGKYGKRSNIRKMIDETLNSLFISDCIRYDIVNKKYYLNISFPAF